MSEMTDQVVEYLNTLSAFGQSRERRLSKQYASPAEFILRNGMEFEPAELPREVQRGEIKQCYQNTYNLALGRQDLIYVEGYAAGVIPVQHAWCVTSDGKVVDPTWEDGIAYFGVPIRSDYMIKYALKSGYYGILCDWVNQWPIMEEPRELWAHPILKPKLV